MVAVEFLRYFPRRKQNGPADWHVPCPGHDDHAHNPDKFSLHITSADDRLLLHCFAGCETASILAALGATAADLFLRDAHGLAPTPVGRSRDTRTGPRPVFAPEPTSAPEGPATLAAFAALKKLPVDLLTAEGWRDTAKGIAIPYLQRDGSAWRVRGRTSLEPGAGFRWDGQKDRGLIPYGRHRLDQVMEKGELWLVEGESDAVTAWYRGLPCLGIPGNLAGKVLAPEDLTGIETLWIVLEPGQSGEGFTGAPADARLDGHGQAGAPAREGSLRPACGGPRGFPDGGRARPGGRRGSVRSAGGTGADRPAASLEGGVGPEVLQRYIDETQADQRGRLPFNVPAFDAVLRGLGRGDVAVVLGSLGVGKTGFLINLLERITALHRIPALIASLEMADTQVAERMASFTLRKPGREIEELVVRRDPWVVHALTREAADAWRHVRIIDVPLTIDALDQELTLAAKESPLRVVAVDYLGLLTTGMQAAYQEVSRVARATKTLAKKHKVSILMLVQTSRAGDAGTPVTIHMARDSGVIGEAVDLAFGLWRPALAEKATPEEKVRWEHYLIARVLKARSSEQGHVFRMDWRPATWHIDNAVRIDSDTLEEVRESALGLEPSPVEQSS